jgi:hypothetical protein
VSGVRQANVLQAVRMMVTALAENLIVALQLANVSNVGPLSIALLVRNAMIKINAKNKWRYATINTIVISAKDANMEHA